MIRSRGSAIGERDVGGLVRREIVALNRFERSFAHSLDRPHASCSRASRWRNGRIGLR